MICTAHRSDGEPCRKHAIRGGTVCATHGGSTGHIKAAAERRVVEAEARQDAARTYLKHAGEPPGNPLDALRALAARFHAVEADLFARIARQPDQMAALLPAWGASAAKYLDVLTALAKIDPAFKADGIRTIQDLLNVPDGTTFTLSLAGSADPLTAPPPPALPPPAAQNDPEPMPESSEPAGGQNGHRSGSLEQWKSKKELRAEADAAEAEALERSPWKRIEGTDWEEA